jgi:hypothetical protein
MNNSQRRYVRMDSLNFLDYVVLDESEKITAHAMGRTINISEKGILMETHIPIALGQIVRVTIGLEDDLVDVKGQVKHAEDREDKRYGSGIEFIAIDSEGIRVVRSYLKAFEAFEQ